MDKNTARLIEAIDLFPRVKVLIIGDIMLDEYIWGTVDRISPEAPIPVVNVNRETRHLGAAANVIRNILTVGGRAAISGVIGDDQGGRRVMEMLEELGNNADGVLVDPRRVTTIKTRIIAHAQQVVRFDREQRHEIGPELTEAIIAYVGRTRDSLDAVLISDYGKGVITADLMEKLRGIMRERGVIITVDPNISNFPFYRDVTILTPNHHEAAAGAGTAITSEESLRLAADKIIENLNCASVLITRGAQGMSLFQKERPVVHIPSAAREVFDGTGAGDTVIAVLTLAMAAGLSLPDAALLSNFAAGIVCGKIGCAAVTPDELKKEIESRAGSPA